MYSYELDPSTGGYILNSILLKFSKEPRPAYYKELDMLGFDRYWSYEKDDTYPYMWAEANVYWYRGRKVAQTKGERCANHRRLRYWRKLNQRKVNSGSPIFLQW